MTNRINQICTILREKQLVCARVKMLFTVFKGAYHLARKSGNFGLKSNGKVIFRKFHSEIVEYRQRYSSFSVWNRTAEISLPFAKLSSFQSLISQKQLWEIEVQIVSAFRSVRLLILEKLLPLFNACPNWFILTNCKHPHISFPSRDIQVFKICK